ncbi:helix-turn-helix domain-containing protein [Flavonifractor plautii]|jgi:putative transcriptional regulator|uniref:helix-turn-helix domain-containing protein n=1 Tax=Flavonifractor plautii TaxID=292800 RepID=UPI003D7CF70E
MSEPFDYGHFDIVLAEYLREKKVSKNYLAEKANLQRTQLNAYCKNAIKRPDLDVLARICYALNCDLPDIIRYVRPLEKNGGNSDGRYNNRG